MIKKARIEKTQKIHTQSNSHMQENPKPDALTFECEMAQDKACEHASNGLWKRLVDVD